jgi:YD repeat-containing protein
MYDSTFHNVTEAIDPLRLTTTYFYNGTGDLTATIDPLSDTTKQTWSNGLLQTVTDLNTLTTSFLYDTDRRRGRRIRQFFLQNDSQSDII